MSTAQPPAPSLPRAQSRGRWGGRRPGAGAPTGNLNGLKHGLRSRQIRDLAERWAHDPEMRSVLVAFGRYTGVTGRAVPWQGPAPPPMTQRELNLFAQTLAKHAIKRMKKDGIWRGP